MNKLEEMWLDFCIDSYLKPCDGVVLQSKVHSYVDWIVPGWIWNQGIDLSWGDMGYKGRSTKMAQLKRNYLNVEEIKAANAKFLERGAGSSRKASQSCITATMGAVKKRKESQGFCMLTATINHLNGKLYIDMNYRSTELTQKFFADLKFLTEVVVPMLLEGSEIELTAVRFHFSIVYVSAIFLPVIYQFVDPLDFLLNLRETDEEFLRKSVMKEITKLMKEEHTYSYRTRINQWNFFRDKIYPTLDRRQIAGINRLIKVYS